MNWKILNGQDFWRVYLPPYRFLDNFHQWNLNHWFQYCFPNRMKKNHHRHHCHCHYFHYHLLSHQYWKNLCCLLYPGGYWVFAIKKNQVNIIHYTFIVHINCLGCILALNRDLTESI